MAELAEETDVVVVGAGLAGHTAALAAAEEGADVVLLEKTGSPGGSSVLAGGGLLFAGTDLQRAAGVEDSPEALRAALAEAGRGHSDPALLDAYARHELDTYAWLCGLGATFELAPGLGSRLHAMPRGALVALLHRRVLDSPGVTYAHDAAVETLVRTDGRVTGVVVATGSGPVAVRARAGVVLASGGFSRSPELVERFAPHCAGAVPMGGSGSHGDGIRLALECGADLAGMEFVEPSYGASADAGVPPRLLYAQHDGAVIVNARGRRFADERSDIKALGRACVAQPGGLSFQVFDQAVMDRSRPTPSPRDFAAALAAGLVRRAPTLPELAAALGVPGPALRESVAEYCAGLAADDPRSGLASPPFYGYACRAGLSSTYGGVRVDRHLRPLTGAGLPVPGLAAAGEVVGGFHGSGYLVGSALGKAAIFGRIAGRTIVGRAAPEPAVGASRAAAARRGGGRRTTAEPAAQRPMSSGTT